MRAIEDRDVQLIIRGKLWRKNGAISSGIQLSAEHNFRIYLISIILEDHSIWTKENIHNNQTNF